MFAPIIKDIIFSVFTDPNEQKVFRNALLGMLRNYPEVLNDTKKTMTVFPESFQFDTRIDQHNTVVLPVLEEIKNELDQTHADFMKIKKFIEKIKPQVAEGDIFDPLLRFFYIQRGLFLHSLKMDSYLKSFSNLSKEYRRNNKTAPPQLTALEEKLKTAFSIDDNDLNAPHIKFWRILINKVIRALFWAQM